MKAIQINEFGGTEQLALTQVEQPVPGKDEVLIKINAAGLNRADILQRMGHYPPPAGVTDIPGLEVSGIIDKSNSPKWQVGEHVCALLAGGGYAEYCVVDAGSCLPIPETIDITSAASLPEAVFTVWNNIFDIGKFKANDTVLIHGGSSGIGTMAIQMVKAMGGTAIITAGSKEKCDACTGLGADLSINYKEDDYVQSVKDFTQGRGVDIILDMIGGEYIARDIKIMAYGARHINIAYMGGRTGEIDIARVMQKRLIFTGSTLRAQPEGEKTRLAEGIKTHIWPLIKSADIKPVIYKTFPLEHAKQAHECMEDGQHIGKILLTL